MANGAGIKYRRATPWRVALAFLPVVLIGAMFATRPGGIEVALADPTTCHFNGTTAESQFVLAGQAQTTNPGWRITPDIDDAYGQVWFGQKVPVEVPGGFVTDFNFQFAPGSIGYPWGADGVAFVIQNSASPTTSGVGDPPDLKGGGKGYGGIADSIAVQFDSFENPESDDPSGNFVSVQSNGTGPNSSSASARLGATDLAGTPVLADGNFHQARIVYNPAAAQSLQVFIDNMSTPALTVSVDIGTLLNLPASTGAAWVGVGAGTGVYHDQHDVTGWGYCADPPPPPPTNSISIPATTPPVNASLSSGQNALWTVPIQNTSGSALHNVTATMHATANGPTPLGFVGASMPGCAPGTGNSEVCALPDIPAHSTQSLNIFAATTGLNAGRTITGNISVSATGAVTKTGQLGLTTMVACGQSCVVAAVPPGAIVKTPPPTVQNPTQQIVSLPAQAGAPAIPVTLQSINPGPSLPAAEKLLCPTTGTKCSGQISVVKGDFSKYANKAKPVEVKIVAKWDKVVPPGKIMMASDSGALPVQLAKCVFKVGKYNTPCAKPEVITGTAAKKNLTTISTILINSDPRFARRVVTGPDAPIGVKATAGKGKATVTWKAPVVTNGRITAYTVTPRLGKTPGKAITFKGTVFKGVVSGLQKGKSYTFTIVAKTATGVSIASKPSNAIKPT